MKRLHKRILVVLAVLVMAALACNAPVNRQGPPPSPEPLTEDQVQQLEDQIQATLDSANTSGQVTVTITEQELHSYIVSRLAEQPDQIITDPQVNLTSGKIEVYGKVNQSGLSIDSKIAMVPVVADGKLRLVVDSISLGPIQVTAALRDRVQALVDNLLDDYLAASQGQFQVTSISVTENELIVTGVPQP